MGDYSWVLVRLFLKLAIFQLKSFTKGHKNCFCDATNRHYKQWYLLGRWFWWHSPLVFLIYLRKGRICLEEKSLYILGKGLETPKVLYSTCFSKCIDVAIEIFLIVVAILKEIH